jgi:hypothetical protein
MNLARSSVQGPLNAPKWFRHLPLSFWGLAALLGAAALLWAPVNKDAGYFLSTARAIAEGDAPFRDVAMRYPPVGFWALALVGKLFGFARHEVFTAFILVVQLANCIILYRLAGRLFAHSIVQGLTAASYFLAFFLNDGPFVMLEPFLVLGALSAALCVLKAEETDGSPFWYIVAGMLAGVSVMSKQYGLAPVGILGIYVLFGSGVSWARSLVAALWMLLGGMLFGLLFFGIIWFWSGISPLSLVQMLLSAGEDYGYHRIDWAVKFLLKHILWFSPLLLLAFLFPVGLKERRPAWLVLSLFASLLPLYFKQYPHYTQIYLPYAFLLAHWGIGQVSEKRGSWFSWAVWGQTALCLWLSANALLTVGTWRSNDENARLRVLADRARSLVPNDEKCLLYGVQHLYYLADLQPADKARYGFRFRPPWQSDTAILKNVAFVLVDRSKKDQQPVPPPESILLESGFIRLEDTPGRPELEWWSKTGR